LFLNRDLTTPDKTARAFSGEVDTGFAVENAANARNPERIRLTALQTEQGARPAR
jgi:hypothetical protein